MAFRVIDSDAHVVEGSTFIAEMAQRFPGKVQFKISDRGPSLPWVVLVRRGARNEHEQEHEHEHET